MIYVLKNKKIKQVDSLIQCIRFIQKFQAKMYSLPVVIKLKFGPNYKKVHFDENIGLIETQTKHMDVVFSDTMPSFSHDIAPNPVTWVFLSLSHR